MRYYLASDTIDDADIDALVAWLKTRPRLTKDKLTLDFEANWSEWLGRKYACFNNSGSSANLLMYYTLDIWGKLKNKKVIVPSAGWVTTIAPAIQFGFEPIMCESDPDTFGLDLNHLESLLKEHDAATVALVQVLGVPHKMDAIMKLKEKYGFILLEDACASIGSVYKSQKIGTFGDMASFSLYFGHQMSTIEGGIVSTDHPELHNLLMMLRSHGWSKDVEPAVHEKLVQDNGIDNTFNPFVFYEPGFNLRSTDLNAFLGLRQLEKAAFTTERRHANHKQYQSRLKDHARFQICDDPDATLASISFCMLAKSTDERNKIAQRLVDEKIETRLYTAGNLGRHPFWTKRYGNPNLKFADTLYANGIFLPNNPSLSLQDIDIISDIILGVLCQNASS